MINAIGEVTMQQFIRINFNSDLVDKNLTAQNADKVRKQRPVEESDDGQKPEMNLQLQENVKSRTRLEDGKFIIEKYDEDGRLVKKTPPGFLPFGESV